MVEKKKVIKKAMEFEDKKEVEVVKKAEQQLMEKIAKAKIEIFDLMELQNYFKSNYDQVLKTKETKMKMLNELRNPVKK